MTRVSDPSATHTRILDSLVLDREIIVSAFVSNGGGNHALPLRLLNRMGRRRPEAP